MHEFKIYPSNLRRHKKENVVETKFTYLGGNLNFPPSRASGKPQTEVKNVNKSVKYSERFVFNETSFDYRKIT